MNILSPRLDTICAASFIGCAPSTLKISRVTGSLLGHPAPQYLKIGRKVIYDKVVLDTWLAQFVSRRSTAE